MLEKTSPEAVQGTALPLQGVDHVHGGDGLALGVLELAVLEPEEVEPGSLGAWEDRHYICSELWVIVMTMRFVTVEISYFLRSDF